MKAKLDHLILGIHNLDEGSKMFEEQTGVKPAFGGIHPAYGTQNSLISIGQGAYLEIIAPQNINSDLTGPFKGYDQMGFLTPCGWAISCNLVEMENLLNNLSVPNTGIAEGSRRKENGELLKWKTLFLTENGTASINPFFLEWDPDSIHPSRTEPKGCEVMEWSVTTIESSAVSSVLSDLDLEITFQKGPKPGWLSALSLDTPQGLISFDSE